MSIVNHFFRFRFVSSFSPPARLALGGLALFILGVSVISFRYAIYKPYTLDEVEEARMTRKINEIGPATFHSSAQGGGGEDLSHPLLYSYVNAVFFKFFGPREVSLRGHGLLWFLFSLIILVLLSKNAFKGGAGGGAAAIFSAVSLYLLNPLLIQHSLILNNSDNNISAFAILLFVYLFFKFEERREADFIRTRLLLALVVAFNYMCKELTPTFLMLSVVLYRLINREFRKLILELILTIGLGLVIFCVIWAGYCFFTNTDVLAFIKFTTMRKGKKVTLEFILRQFKFFFIIWKWPVYWVSFPFFALVFICVFERVKAFLKEKALNRVDFVVLASVFMFAPYIFVKPSIDMMKYQYPVYPLLVFLITWLMITKVFYPLQARSFDMACPAIKLPSRELFVYFSALVIFAGSWWYYQIGDYILILWGRLPLRFLAGYYIPVTILVVLFGLFFRKWGWYRSALCSLFLSIYPINAGLNFVQTADYTTAESWLNYGERGQMDAVEYLRARIDKRMTQYIRKDLDYYLRYRCGIEFTVSDPTMIFRVADEGALNAIFRSADIQYFVFERTSSVQRANPDILNILGKYFLVEKQCGDFVILRHKASIKR